MKPLVIFSIAFSIYPLRNHLLFAMMEAHVPFDCHDQETLGADAFFMFFNGFM